MKIITDRNEAMEMVAKNGINLQYLSPELQDDEELVRIAVNQDGWALGYASPRLQDNDEIVKIALSRDSDALQFASHRLQKLLK